MGLLRASGTKADIQAADLNSLEIVVAERSSRSFKITESHKIREKGIVEVNELLQESGEL